MSLLLDTNVVSEWSKAEPSRAVQDWFEGVDESSVFLCIVTLAGIRYGIELMPEGRKRRDLWQWLHRDVTDRFDGRLIPIESRVAEKWATLMAQEKMAGRALKALDGFIAATALVHGLALVTRNVRDFQGLGLNLINPWAS